MHIFTKEGGWKTGEESFGLTCYREWCRTWGRKLAACGTGFSCSRWLSKLLWEWQSNERGMASHVMTLLWFSLLQGKWRDHEPHSCHGTSSLPKHHQEEEAAAAVHQWRYSPFHYPLYLIYYNHFSLLPNLTTEAARIPFPFTERYGKVGLGNRIGEKAKGVRPIFLSCGMRIWDLLLFFFLALSAAGTKAIESFATWNALRWLYNMMFPFSLCFFDSLLKCNHKLNKERVPLFGGELIAFCCLAFTIPWAEDMAGSVSMPCELGSLFAPLTLVEPFTQAANILLPFAHE